MRGVKRPRSVWGAIDGVKARRWQQCQQGGNDAAEFWRIQLRLGLRWLGFELRRGGALGDAVADADEFQHGADAGVAEAGSRQAHDARVTAGAINEPRRDDFEADFGGGLAAQEPHDAAAGLDHGSHRGGPLLPLAAFAPAAPLITVSIGRRAKFACLLERWQRVASNGYTALHKGPHFLGLLNGRDDPPFHLRRLLLVEIIVLVALGQEQRRSEISQKCFAMRWRAAKNAASFTMSHGKGSELRLRQAQSSGVQESG